MYFEEFLRLVQLFMIEKTKFIFVFYISVYLLWYLRRVLFSLKEGIFMFLIIFALYFLLYSYFVLKQHVFYFRKNMNYHNLLQREKTCFLLLLNLINRCKNYIFQFYPINSALFESSRDFPDCYPRNLKFFKISKSVGAV